MPDKKTNASYTGINALLAPEECALLLIDHQGAQFANLHSHEPQLVVNNAVALAKTAKLFGIPTVLTTVVAARSGNIIGGIQSVFPDQQPIDRTSLNSWQDTRFTKAVEKTGRKKLVMAGLWTEVCVAMPAIQALGEGYDVYVVSDASGGVSAEAHAMAIERMAQAGVRPMTWVAVLCEWLRDWATHQDKQAEMAGILIEHGGSSGAAFAWGNQLLASAGKA
jgi:nicotinamidase-related amidase